MKTQLILKIAVVAMAALGAYAFSGNNANEQLTFKRSDTCQNITAACSNQNEGPKCMIEVIESGQPIEVYDTLCEKVIRHSNSLPVIWTPVNP